MNSPLEEVKSRLDIVEVIQTYTRLQKAGINYRANCPFHTEKTPSFFVSPVRQIWHCFGGCGDGGDIFKFVMKMEGLEFPEALRLLAQRAGVVLKREDPSLRSEKNRLYDICEEAAKIFEKNLSLTLIVQDYLKKRGVKDETRQEFRIGFAPQSWDFLLRALTQKGFKKEEVEKAGLAVKSEDGISYYDRFRNRIMFPITNVNGQVIGFGGRIFEPEDGSRKSEAVVVEAKYVNTPNTLIYDKSRVLYGFDRAKNDIRIKNQVVVVEGYMDCLMSHQAGVRNTIAVSGTALTSEQLKTLRRLTDTIISSFDTDMAGESATKRSLALAVQFEFERKIASIPAGKDPADTVLENPAWWQKAVEEAKPIVDFYFEKIFRNKDFKSAQGKKEIAALLIPLIRELTNEIEKAHWVMELAKRLNLKEEAVWKELGHRQNDGVNINRRIEDKKSPEPLSRRELLEERMLALLSVSKEEVRQRELADHNIVFISSLNQQLFDILQNESLGSILTPMLAGKVELLKFKGEILVGMKIDLEKEFKACKRELGKECLKEKLVKLGDEIEQKEKNGNSTELVSLLQDFRNLSEKLKILF